MTKRGMTRRDFLRSVGLGAAGLAAGGLLGRGGAWAAEPERPNILFIMSDQHRWDVMGCMGHPLVRTPQLDRLARDGVLFESAYCPSPLCVPSRMSLITGRAVHSHGALDNHYALPEGEQTIGHHFRAHGYTTGAIGKMHFIDRDQRHGFDVRVEYGDYARATGRGFQPTAAADDLGDAVVQRRGGKAHETQRLTMAGVSAEDDTETYEYYLASRMANWLAQAPKSPFCMWLSFHAPHPPYLTPEVYYRMYEGKVSLPAQPPPGYLDRGPQDRYGDEAEQLRMITGYLGRITSVDKQIGRALDALECAGLRGNTIIVYTSDHGDMMGERGRFNKRVMYDPATRVPLIVSYPRRLAEGLRRAEVVEQVDLFPTLCELASLPTPGTVQGRSLVPFLCAGGNGVAWPNTAFSELGGMLLVRENQYKLTLYDGKPLELYDVEQDPREFRNLIDEPGSAAVVARLTRLRDDWMARTQPDVRGQVCQYRKNGQRRDSGEEE